MLMEGGLLKPLMAPGGGGGQRGLVTGELKKALLLKQGACSLPDLRGGGGVWTLEGVKKE